MKAVEPAHWAEHPSIKWSFLLVVAIIIVSTVVYQIRQMPEDAAGYLERGTNAASKGQYAKALANLNRAIEFDPDDPRVLTARGDVRSRMGHHDAALADYDRVVELTPDRPAPYAGRATAKLRRDDLDGAAEDYSRAVALSPDQGGYVLALASMELYRDRWEAAGDALARAAELLDGSPEADRARLLGWIARARLGALEAGGGEPDRQLARIDSGTRPWLSTVARFLTDSVSEPALISEAESAGNVDDVNARLCEALFFAGTRRSLDGDVSGSVALLRDALGYGTLEHPGFVGAGALLRDVLFGLRVRPADRAATSVRSLEPGVGLTISHVRPGGPADLAGLQAGDVLVSIDGTAARLSAVWELEANREPGTQIAVESLRGGTLRRGTLTLGAGRSPG